MSKILQDCSLIAPSLITTCSTTLRTMRKLEKLLEREGMDMLKRPELFPKTSKLLTEITNEEAELIPYRTTRQNDNPTNRHSLFHGYLLSGKFEAALESVEKGLSDILPKLQEFLITRLESIVENPVIKAMAVFLDARSFNLKSVEDVYENVKVIVNHFEKQLTANNCDLTALEREFEQLYEHVNLFLQTKESHAVWPQLFMCKHELGISNILHVAELSLAMPLSNAESERVFSFLWRVLSKERKSLSNSALENILRLRCDQDFSPQRYSHAIELFLSEYPDGTVRKGSRRVDGITQPSKKRKCNDKSVVELLDDLVSDDEIEVVSDDQIDEQEERRIEDIPLPDISSDEWSSSESEEE